ncbi:hypothetical protein K450DRAFT_276329 [Umbelopsis ramanniana AG]|uniref:FAD-binding domain-containing protein n=1 Tax=Umbelopsis ramanniana AG TaxID=1314678 RepID=A0AAD5ELQ5_UMBRA|nr:uncharacterized protein K450DRAFT_276329 [Umbelopsis ramanniana AG]KAI8584665.1 hypothetical protein K450DRAFT_276329 [Umbelopsis ramanniana AG]
MDTSQNLAPDASQFKIAVVGGGLGGLTLASVLQHAYKIKCTVFELDDTVDSRSQGGSLDLHFDSGQLALKKAGLLDQFRKHARYQGQDTDRKLLRQILIDSLNDGTIQWGKKVNKVEEVSKNQDKNSRRHTLTFQDGQTETFDLVVGADGAWSKIRKFVSEATPFYTGIFFAEVCLSNADVNHPTASKLVGNGTYMALQDNKGLLCQRNGDGSIRGYIMIRIEENGVSHLDFSNPEIPRNYFLERLSDWDDSVKVFIKEATYFIPRGCYMLPTDHTWKSHPGVTLIGDAAHLMSPFAGEGANMAMLDGANLAAAISEIVHDGKDLATTIENFEREMHNIVTGPAIESAENIDMFMSDDAPQGVVDFFTMAYGGGAIPQ